jgi:hypothetical protein
MASLGACHGYMLLVGWWMRNIGVQFGVLPQLQAPSGMGDEVGWMENVVVQFGSLPRLHAPSGLGMKLGG